VVERPAQAAPAPPPQQVSWTAQSFSTPIGQPVVIRRRSSCSGAIFTLVLFVVIGLFIGQTASRGRLLAQFLNLAHGNGTIATAISQVSATAVSRVSIGSITTIAAVLPRDGAGGDLLVYSYGIDDERYKLALIDGRSRATRWQSAPLSKDAYQGRLVAGRDLVYLTDQSDLLALSLRDGKPAWQASLVVEPPSGCDDCLRLVGNHVIVLQKDGSLQAFDAQSGQLSWSIRLEGTPRSLPVAGDRLVALHTAAGKQELMIDFIDPASGKATQQIAPHCPPAHASFGNEYPRADTPMLFSADGSALYLMYGFFKKCAQRWDIAAGQAQWEVPLDDKQVPTIWLDNAPLLTEQAIFTSNEGQIWALDTGSGAVRTLVDEKEYTLVPLALRDGTLIALAAPTWDSHRLALWGLDATSGERRWQVALAAHEPSQLRGLGDWDWRLTPKGLVVVQVLRDQTQLSVQTIALRTGVISGQQVTDLTNTHMPTLQSITWADDMAWLKIDNSVYAIDLATGATAYHLP
jgi:outer membrane protein assembly factor BamB